MKTHELIGDYCREYRITKLKLTLSDIEESNNIKTLSAFEHGNSTNLNHMFKYINKIDSYTGKVEFLEGMIERLGGRIE